MKRISKKDKKKDYAKNKRKDFEEELEFSDDLIIDNKLKNETDIDSNLDLENEFGLDDENTYEELELVNELGLKNETNSLDDVSEVKSMKKNTKKKKVKSKKNNKVKKEKKQKKQKRKWWKRLLSFFLICGALGVFAVFAFCIYIVSSCGEFDPNALANQEQTVIYDNSGNTIAKLGMEKRESVTYDELPQVLIDAIVATEDSRYFEHNGVDGARFLKASVEQLLGNSSAGGASTLTMQVVKNNLTSTEQTITRKFKDVYLAVFFMEEKYTKKEILEFYVNDSYLGGSVYGVEEASKYYFGKSVSELSLPEATIIAGLFQAPSSYNPYNYPEATEKRRNTVLKLMVRHGYITQEEADIANAVDVSSLLVGNSNDSSYQGFIDTVVAEVEKKTGFDPAVVSMEIHTTMNASIQDGIDKVLAGDGYTWKVEKDGSSKVQAGVSIVDVNTGAIVAIGAGRNRTGERTWNYATQTLRQPGSTAKPIFAYAPGFEFDNFSTYQLFVDEKWHYSDGTDFGNWDNSYKGLMTLREALAISRNVPAVKALQTVNENVGNKKIVEFVEGLGIDLEDDVAYESYSIGGLRTGVNTLQMAAAYASFANGGYYIEPYTVKSITYRDTDETIEFEVNKKQAMKDSTAYLITNVLEYASKHGFDGGTKGFGGTIAVKTGTSNFTDNALKTYGLPANAVNDLWSVAYTPQYSIALWYGYKNPTEGYNASSDGSKYKDPLMKALLKHVPATNEGFTMPSSVVKAKVEDETWPAMKPSKYTPESLIKTEYFISGTEPTEESTRFAQLKPVSNLKTTSTDNGVKLTWDCTEPDAMNEEHLKTYFNQSIFGDSSNDFLQERLSYNQNTLGGFGYRIYLKNSNGDLKEVGYSTEKSYLYTDRHDGEVTLVVKAEYKNFNNNASDGVEVKFIVKNNTNKDNDDNKDNDNKENNDVINKDLTVTLNGKSEVTADFGKYKENGIKISYNGKEISDKDGVKISYYLGNSQTGIQYISLKAIEDAINKLKAPKKIIITYKIEYNSENKEITRTVNLTDSNHLLQ